MKILAFNGSPRKEWNTATLLNKALEGAASQGATTELFHIYDLNYKGCISCFACKIIGGKSYGKCPIQDDLAPIFKQIEEADAIILGSPIYFGRVTGEMASFMDRLLFQYLEYSGRSLFPKKINTGFIYTGNIPEDKMHELFQDKPIESTERAMKTIFGSSETLISYETVQFPDFSKVVVTMYDVEARLKRREEIFPIDCQKAFDMGVRLVTKSI